MPQLALLMMMVMMPMEILSGSVTPYESMPRFIRNLMQASPTTHFVSASQAILYRSAGIEVVWPQFLALATIGSACFLISLRRFRSTIGQMA